MKRDGNYDLRVWAEDPSRRPLIVRGARQTGKTWLVEQFAGSHFGTVATVDFERDPKAASLFEAPSPRDNLQAIEAYLGKRIIAGESLLFLDEVQVAPRVLSRLRYFHEELPELHVVAAGSLLDFALADTEYRAPVGRVSYFYLEPLSFREYLDAMDLGGLRDVLSRWQPGVSIPEAVHEKLLREVRAYALVGGMPAVVEAYRQERSFVGAARLHADLLTAYREDFARYGSRATVQRLHRVLNSVPVQVGRKFIYARVDREDRAAPIKQALDQLCMARVVHRVNRSNGNGVPLAAEVDERAFKTILLDVGLMLSSLGVPPSRVLENELTLVNEGAVAEQLVGQMLRTLGPRNIDPSLYYWQRDKKGSEAEVDYLIQHAGRVVPIEVKAGKSGRLRSLHTFMAAKGYGTAIRVHSHAPELRAVETPRAGGSTHRYDLLSIPFYMVEEIPRLLTAGGPSP